MASTRVGPGTARLAATAAIVAAVVASLSCQAPSECDVCGRHEFSALAFRVEYADGGEVNTCCPRCASHLVAMSPDRPVAKLFARDFATGREIDAHGAVFVDGSDHEHCDAPKEERMTRESLSTLAYDRCLPSLIAFSARSDAEAFTRRHGGTIRPFEEIGFGRK